MPAFHATESCNRCQDLSRHKNAYNFGSLYGYNIENQSRLNLIFPKKRLAGMRQKATHLNHFAHCLSYFFQQGMSDLCFEVWIRDLDWNCRCDWTSAIALHFGPVPSVDLEQTKGSHEPYYSQHFGRWHQGVNSPPGETGAYWHWCSNETSVEKV